MRTRWLCNPLARAGETGERWSKDLPHASRRSDTVRRWGACGEEPLSEFIDRTWIARQHGLSDAAIRKRAKAKGWTRGTQG
jgi:hypothetical protein